MRGTGALVINALLDFFSYALCVPYSETTDSAHFDMLLEMLAGEHWVPGVILVIRCEGVQSVTLYSVHYCTLINIIYR